MKTRPTNIAIIGAGPAGARAAELLAGRGADVILIDPKAPWEKPCGGGLTESTFADVPDLWELESMTRAVQEMRVETDSEHGFTVPLSRPIRIVSRRELGRWQLDRALEAGARHLPERVHSIRRTYGVGWVLETTEGEIRADYLVGADGAASLVRRVAAPKFQVELAPTRVSFVPGAGPTPESLLVRFFPNVAGYVWDFPRPDHRSVGVGIQGGQWRRPQMDNAVDEFRRAAESCTCGDADVLRAGAVIGTAQLGHGDFTRVAGDDFALLGDAAGFADPATGEGIRNALRSAEFLGRAWASDGTFDAYPTLAREAFAREFTVSRVLRRIVLESDGAQRILASGSNSASTQALVATVADAINEHDGSVFSLAGRLWRSWREFVRDADRTRSGGRVAAPCERTREEIAGGTCVTPDEPGRTTTTARCGA